MLRASTISISLLIDEAKTIGTEIFDTLERCHTTFRLFMSSTGPAAGGFYQICTAKAHLWRTFRVTSSDCLHVSTAEIEADRENLKDSVFRIKHAAEWLYDAGDSMISLEHVRALLAYPPAVVTGKVRAFCDFAGPGDESVLAMCSGNVAKIIDCWRHRDTMHSTGKFISLFRKLGLNGYQIGGDEEYGHQLMDRMAEQGYCLKRFNNGSVLSGEHFSCRQSGQHSTPSGPPIFHRTGAYFPLLTQGRCRESQFWQLRLPARPLVLPLVALRPARVEEPFRRANLTCTRTWGRNGGAWSGSW
jgi:hypothetical protein